MAQSQTAADFEEHEKTFSLFLGLIKWSSVIIAVVLILMFIFLVGNPYA